MTAKETLDLAIYMVDLSLARSAAARETKSEEILKILAKDSDYIVRKAVAENNYTPLSIKTKLVYWDVDPRVRAAAVKFLDDSLSTLSNRSRMEDSPLVIKELCSNKNVPRDTLGRLFRKVQKWPDANEDGVFFLKLFAINNLARNPQTSKTVLRQISRGKGEIASLAKKRLKGEWQPEI